MWNNEEEFEKYVDAQKPANYDDFLEEVKKHISKEIKVKITKLFNYKFAKSNKYSRNEKQIKMIESMIRERASEIINKFE